MQPTAQAVAQQQQMIQLRRSERIPTVSRRDELKQVQAAIAGAERGNWRDLRTVFEFAGISAQNKDSAS
jgi:hypothetical protein